MEYFNKLLLQSCIFRIILILFWAMIFCIWGIYHSSFSKVANKSEIYSKSYNANQLSLPFKIYFQTGRQISEGKKQDVYNSDAVEYESTQLAKTNIGKDQTFSPSENATSLSGDHTIVVGDGKHPVKVPEYSEGAINEEAALDDQPSSVNTQLFKNFINVTYRTVETLRRNSEVSELGTESSSPSKDAYDSEEVPVLLNIIGIIKDNIKQLLSKIKHFSKLLFTKTSEEKIMLENMDDITSYAQKIIKIPENQ